MATTNETARSGKTETLNEVLIRMGYLKPETATQDDILAAILTRIQNMYVCKPHRYVLMAEHWDWLVVLQCLQDNNLFKSNPKQPPLTEFVEWLQTHRVPQMIAIASVRTMSYANNMIAGARYPWNEVTWNIYVIKRWKILYKTLDNMLHDMRNVMK